MEQVSVAPFWFSDRTDQAGSIPETFPGERLFLHCSSSSITFSPHFPTLKSSISNPPSYSFLRRSAERIPSPYRMTTAANFS
jgi:hypothetical protein